MFVQDTLRKKAVAPRKLRPFFALALLIAAAAQAVEPAKGGTQGVALTACQMSCQANDFKCCAKLKFKELSPVFAQFDNFWVLGHSFDTILDYFKYVDATEAPSFASIAFERYGSTVGAGNCWYDDGSWWAIATLKASQFDRFDPLTRGQFLGIAKSLWPVITWHAPNVWVNASSDWSALEPKFTGGVWNYFWTKEKNSNICNTPCDPTSSNNTVCGFQNTVTNGLYLILASRMHLLAQDSQAQEAANIEYQFLTQWFEEKGTTSLLDRNPFSSDEAVVRERVGVYKSGSRTGYYDPDVAWTGDQGLVLGGLVDQMQISRNGPTYAAQLQYAKMIAAGVRKSTLVKDGALQPWRPSPPANDSCDYATGPGVFMRYLLYANRTNADLRTYLQSSGYPTFVRDNARLVFEGKQYQINPLTTSCWGQPPGAMVEVINLTNDLATLVAAAGFEGASSAKKRR